VGGCSACGAFSASFPLSSLFVLSFFSRFNFFSRFFLTGASSWDEWASLEFSRDVFVTSWSFFDVVDSDSLLSFPLGTGMTSTMISK